MNPYNIVRAFPGSRCTAWTSDSKRSVYRRAASNHRYTCCKIVWIHCRGKPLYLCSNPLPPAILKSVHFENVYGRLCLCHQYLSLHHIWMWQLVVGHLQESAPSLGQLFCCLCKVSLKLILETLYLCNNRCITQSIISYYVLIVRTHS